MRGFLLPNRFGKAARFDSRSGQRCRHQAGMYDRLTRSLVAELFAFCIEPSSIHNFARPKEHPPCSPNTLHYIIRGAVLFLCCCSCIFNCQTLFLHPCDTRHCHINTHTPLQQHCGKPTLNSHSYMGYDMPIRRQQGILSSIRACCYRPGYLQLLILFTGS